MADPRRALVIDDNLTNRVLAQALLGKLGWQADQADNGASGLAQALAGDYPLILLDISMPGMSGLETCRALRARPEGARMRIIAYTAHAFPEERDEILAAGFDDIIVKPVNTQTMAATIQRFFP